MEDVKNFETEVLEQSKKHPVLVDFWATWCAPCRMLGPVIEEAAQEANGTWTLAKVNTETMPEIAMKYGVRSIPNVKLFVNGEVVDEFVGAIPKAAINDFMDKALKVHA